MYELALIQTRDFNPLPPRGGRQFGQHRNCSYNIISIHSLRVEGDSKNSQITDAFYKAKSEFSQKAVLIIA